MKSNPAAGYSILNICMIGTASAMILLTLIGELALSVALAIAVIKEAHSLVVVFALCGLVVAGLFFLSIRILSMELAENRRSTCVEKHRILIDEPECMHFRTAA
ncbi:MAG TPA: hypothetical protein VK452_10510 [Dissulfurispiraceae bacterium]|nr:hypothetical protein [Dissulfurispiraceae bacterium]